MNHCFRGLAVTLSLACCPVAGCVSTGPKTASVKAQKAATKPGRGRGQQDTYEIMNATSIRAEYVERGRTERYFQAFGNGNAFDSGDGYATIPE